MIGCVNTWSVAETNELAHAIAAARNPFYSRRVLQRLERGEFDVWKAIALLKGNEVSSLEV
jgi:hypothetical protein